MHEMIRNECEKAKRKRDEIKAELNALESESPKDHYRITITRDRLAYWEGKTDGLQFALDQLGEKGS